MTTWNLDAHLTPIRTIGDVRGLEADGWPKGLPATTYALLVQAAETYGTRPAITYFDSAETYTDVVRYSYRELLDQVTRAANLLHSLGIRAGDVVAVVLPNLPEMHFALWGAEAAGVALPINPFLEPAAIAGMLRSSGATVVVTMAPGGKFGLYEKVIASIGGLASIRVLVVDPDEPDGGLPATAAAGVENGGPMSFRAGLAAQRADRLDNPCEALATDTSSLFGTGGTTGVPKLARRTHANEVANAWMAARMMGERLRPTDVIFSGLPLFHVNGALVTGLLALMRGGELLIGTALGFRAPGLIERFWEIAAHHRVTFFSGVPTLYASLLQHPVGDADISSLRFGICGAAPMSPELISQFEGATGVPVYEGYGLTEATCVVASNPFSGEPKTGSVGLPLPFQEVRISIVEGDLEREAAAGEVGRVLIRGPNVFQGYSDPVHEVGIWTDLGEGAPWLDTGDLGCVTTDGYLWLKGRSKDLIIRGGHNLDPQMIEEAFYHHPSVALAAAIGRPDSHSGEVPVVYVQLKPGCSTTSDDLLAACHELIPERAARPKEVRILGSLPLTAVGKVFKPALREMERSLTEEGALLPEPE